LHGERLRSHPPIKTLPNGAMVEHEGFAYAVRNGQFLCWSFAGYTARVELKPMKLLTPPTIIAILRAGYEPRWHESALRWG
jgi:hypothetical protein